MRLILVFIGTLFVVSFFLTLTFVWDAYLSQPEETANSVTLTIEEGDSVGVITQRLEETALVNSPLLFKGYVWLSKTQTSFQPGTFHVKPGMSYAALVKTLTVIETTDIVVTIPEGFTLSQIGERLQSKGLVALDEWYAVVGDPAVDYRADGSARRPKDFSGIFSFLSSKPEYVSLEGYLFPDTYRFFEGATAEEIVVKMLTNFGNKLTPEMRLAMEQQNKSVYDMVRLASVVEREVRTDPDRAMVADLFSRRLQAAIPLQADSTVNYITGKNDPGVLNTDRQVDSLWNTYKYPGLPLSPICNPGVEALQSAVYPQVNTYWYFLTDAEGTVYYAKTNDEHNANRAKYLE